MALVAAGFRTVVQRRFGSAQAAAAAATEFFYERNGPVDTVLKRRSIEDSSSGKALQRNAARVELLAFPLTPFDVAAIERGYRSTGVAGAQGIARVTAAAPETPFQVGDLVLALPAMPGTWRDHATVPNASEAFVAVPATLRRAIEDKVPGMLERAATLLGAPAMAYRLLEEHGIQPGETILLNDADGAVGLALVQLANMRGIKTVSLVDDEIPEDELPPEGHVESYAVVAERIKALGSDVVVSSSFARQTATFRELVSELAGNRGMPRVAFNGSGGASARQLISCLRPHGTLVTYSGRRATQPLVIPTSAFTEFQLNLKGFNLMLWLENAPRDQVQAMVDALGQAMTRGALTGWLERKSFASLQITDIATIRSGTRPRQLVAITAAGQSLVQLAGP